MIDKRLTEEEKKKIKPANQGGGPNYLGKQETVTVPKKWLSDPDHVVAELAYITPREQKILLDANIYGSLKGKPNTGPGGIMSLQGDLGGYDASPGGPNAGGGGGASQIGENASNNSVANGGNGLAVSITGASVDYAGGGGSGTEVNTYSSEGQGGTGGGGTGGTNARTATSGTTNTGGGGGGGGYSPQPYTNGAGGSGIVIVRYPNTYTISVGAGLTSSTATDGSDKVTSFTAGTDTISFS